MKIDRQTISKRIKKFTNLMEVNSAALFLSAEQIHRNSDVEHRFRQDSSFWYLTGFNEADSALLIIKTKKEISTIIFARPKDKEKEVWTGKRVGPDQLKKQTGFKESYEYKELETQLEKKIGGLSHFYFEFSGYNYVLLRSKILEIIKNKRIQNISSTQNLIGELRLIKEDNEIELMKKAAKISAEAHEIALRKTKAGMYEFQIEALIEGHFRENGANWAYPSIVAGGNNATILHYVNNDQKLHKGDLLLIDAGCEYEYYASDITRTFPIESKFTKPQEKIYGLVLKAQQKAIEQAHLKNVSFESVHLKALETLCTGLIDMGLLKGNLKSVLQKLTYRKFYMHKTSHWLGLDVHDVGSYQEPNSEGNSRILKPGMVITIEPGLYFDPEDISIPQEFRGIGVRIEDDILITKNGAEILTAKASK
ncbi:MAG: aminopeptidase P N-terminal domain-containing protein [Candidatus Caenarcaniphilales bacterium]|nr:aminopeptidase P N-terminal domain-containing protein [Candidatus Caenarcaniphilales bacterium]